MHSLRVTHIEPFNGPFPGLPRWAGTRKVKPIRILLKQETVSGSGISRAICKSAPHSRQITTPAPHHSVFYRPDALPAAQPTVSKHWRQVCDEVNNITSVVKLASKLGYVNCSTDQRCADSWEQQASSEISRWRDDPWSSQAVPRRGDALSCTHQSCHRELPASRRCVDANTAEAIAPDMSVGDGVPSDVNIRNDHRQENSSTNQRPAPLHITFTAQNTHKTMTARPI